MHKMISHLLALVEYAEEMLVVLVTESGMQNIRAWFFKRGYVVFKYTAEIIPWFFHENTKCSNKMYDL